ncbi:hypothetical protein HUO09_09380 [Vibrio sp. Y2-5]|uniref:hypothetical protein n=1 Tax=Vibrio sp. Y2-5 TaxID=2743977 RepID=UPI001660B541|nr:hypothetical protein [Vibrio sp. Y2-5]MBD0786558.1 hypothetical protein [Vibrio sp. Y2-5]
MPTLSMSDFSLVVVKSGSPKKTKIKRLSHREDYAHYRDYYGPLRNAIKHLFTGKRHISHLYAICNKQSGSKKLKYELIANTFRDWQSGKNIQAFTSERDYYHYSQTDITCNPELHLVIAGVHRLVKLHFSSSDKMTQERANIMCALMEDTVGQDGFEYVVLDLTNGKEYSFNGNYDKVFERINNEIKNIENLWEDED